MPYTLPKIFISLLILLSTAGLVFLTLAQGPRVTEKPDMWDSVTREATANAILTSCGDVWMFDPQPNQYGVIPEDFSGNIPIHPMIVPAYGYMTSEAFDFDKYDESEYRENPYTHPELIRALWEGNYIIWVSPEFPNDGYDFLVEYSEDWNITHSEKLLVIPWESDVELPANRVLGYSAWATTQTCQGFSETTFQDFIDVAAENDTPRDIENPPVTELVDGKLPTISPDTTNG